MLVTMSSTAHAVINTCRYTARECQVCNLHVCMDFINLMHADVSILLELSLSRSSVLMVWLLPRVSISRLQYLHRKAMHVGSTPDIGRIQIYSFRVIITCVPDWITHLTHSHVFIRLKNDNSNNYMFHHILFHLCTPSFLVSNGTVCCSN